MRKPLFSIVVWSVLLACGCATPTIRSATNSEKLSLLSSGLHEREVTKALNARGEPIFSFLDGDKTYVCRRVFSKDTGFSYYLLWIDNKLTRVCSSADCPDLERTRVSTSAASSLPHQDGFDVLKKPFSHPSQSISDFDFSERKPYYDKDTYYGAPSEWVMWAPIAVVALPFTAPSIAWGNHVYAKMYSLELGMSRKRVLRKLGDPAKTLGNSEGYEILVYTRSTIATEADTLTVSLGLRDREVSWIRYGYDASKDIHAKNPVKTTGRISQDE